MVRILFKFADSEEVAGSLTFERDEDVVGVEPRRFVFTSYSGSSEHTLLEQDSDVICRVYGLSTVEWAESDDAVKEVEAERKEAVKVNEAAKKANEKNAGVARPMPSLVPASGGTRSPVSVGDEK